MKKHSGLATKLISVVASVTLAIGLMPLPAFAVSGDGNAGDSAPNETTLLTAGTVSGEETPLTADAPDNEAETASEDTWDWVHKKIENAKDGDTITLKANTVYKAGPNDNVLEVKKSIKIDLNGSTLNRNLTERKDNGHVIEVSHNATLSILDKAGGGKITGGFSAYGGGIYVYSGSKLELQSGTITGNKAKKAGGGIYAEGTVEIKGGAIDNNISYGKGGGI